MNDMSELGLAKLAKIANQSADDARSHAKASVQNAIRSGQALNAAKEICEFGNWSQWLDQNFAYSARTARTFMKLACADAAIIGNAESVRKALIAISDSQPVATEVAYEESKAPPKQQETKKGSASVLDTTPKEGPPVQRKIIAEDASEVEEVDEVVQKLATRKERRRLSNSEIVQYNAKMMRAVDDRHEWDPNDEKHAIIYECYRQIHDAIESWK